MDLFYFLNFHTFNLLPILAHLIHPLFIFLMNPKRIGISHLISISPKINTKFTFLYEFYTKFPFLFQVIIVDFAFLERGLIKIFLLFAIWLSLSGGFAILGIGLVIRIFSDALALFIFSIAIFVTQVRFDATCLALLFIMLCFFGFMPSLFCLIQLAKESDRFND